MTGMTTSLQQTDRVIIRYLVASAQMQSDSALGVTLLRSCPALCRESAEAGKTPAAVRGRPGRARPRTRRCGLCLGLSTRMTRNLSFGRKSAMAVSIRPLHQVFVGEVAGVDCQKPLGPAEAAAIEAGMDEYAVLVLRGQN